MLLAHFAASGSAALDLPAWALAYAVFAVSVIVILISRNRHVPRPRPRPEADPKGDADAEPAAATSPGRTGRVVRIGRVVMAVLFWVFVGFCWFGPAVLTQNIATLALIGMLWSLGGWVALAFGWVWEAVDPFIVFTREPDDADPGRIPMPWWAPVPVFASYVLIWIAWIAGDEPRHLAFWLTSYGVAMIFVARRGGVAAIRAWNPLPTALDLTAAITRPGKARARLADRGRRRTVGLIATMLLGALGANQAATTNWFITNVGFDGGLDETIWVMAIFAALSAAFFGVWRGCEQLVERARREPGTRPLAAVPGPIAGSVLLAQATTIGLTQTQNILVLISDPFAQGWNLFGTVYWQVSAQPLSPFTHGIVVVAAIVAGHLSALMMIGHAATDRAADGTTSAVARNRAWTAASGAMGLTVVSGVVWTLVLLR
ncbi:MAG TPA: hypothetical protein VFN21_00425 [Acidimicrobiales bacterium]|nr:hypothetical protein [Acidimicrobiales bacterium]